MSKSTNVARSYESLSSEQQSFIDMSLTGNNVLVDACIGSGKTTAIQSLCNHVSGLILSRTQLVPNVLYLTYNNLLKIDAKAKITNRNCQVTNYHGFAYSMLRRIGFGKRDIGIADSIQLFNRHWREISVHCRSLDVMILDEYQDIDQEISEMLWRIASVNPYMQRIAVGDMCQKIYDKTCLDVPGFITDFMGPSAYRLEFTQCFRLQAEHAANIGRVWGKKITGVNDNCSVLHLSFDETAEYLAELDPGDILCLGSNKGPRAKMQNWLEMRYPEKFNKATLWSNISERDGKPRVYDEDSAIFTTYDGCKGMERSVCVIFDWDLAYWELRLGKSGTRYEILRNIFLVAASRGKDVIIFVENDDAPAKRPKYDWGYTRPKKKSKKSIALSWDVLAEPQEETKMFEDVNISNMFDFKYIEHIEAAYNLLLIEEFDRKASDIDIPNFDGMIDLSPCIGMFQEVMYFDNTDIDSYIEEFFATHPRVPRNRSLDYRSWTLDQKILYLASLELNQARYFHQVQVPFVNEFQAEAIRARLSSELPKDAETQRRCQIVFEDAGRDRLFSAVGMCDVLFDGKLWELKFVSALQHTHFLQTAMYMLGHKCEVGRLWNVKDNRMYEIRIPDKQAFLDAVITAVTKGKHRKYYGQLFDASEIGQVGAFDYYNRVWQFCEDNFGLCELLESKMVAGESFNSRQVESYFEQLGRKLPVPGDLYLRYWRECAELIRQSAGL